MSDTATHGLSIDEIEGRPFLEASRAPPATVVIFGAHGDLTRRKLIPALYNLLADGALHADTAIVGVGRRPTPLDDYRAALRESTARFSRRGSVDEALWQDFARRVELVVGDLTGDEVYRSLDATLQRLAETAGPIRLFYFAIPPTAFAGVLEKLHGHGLVTAESRVVIEKPFGRDLTSARQLNGMASRYLEERQTYRIDHYLGKESVQNILVFRFGNSIFEPLWNRKYVDHIQITAAESIGVGGRGRFYESTGVVRDVIQNHLLQVLALITMETPVSFEADDIRDQKAQLLRAVRPIADYELQDHLVFGQYRGYRNEPEVDAQSATPTYAAMKLAIDNWRWQGTPIYLRAGKKLAERRTDVAIHFHTIPFNLFKRSDACQLVEPNVLTIRIQPNEGMSLRYVAKVPGDQLSVANVHMSMTYADAFHTPIAEAYERLLIDAISGDQTLFARRDEVESAWEIVSPALETDLEVAPYDGGSMGPDEAEELLFRDSRRWI